jgi:hypothetical protein
MELRCRGGEREMDVSLRMRLCGTLNRSATDTNGLFHPVVFTYLLASNYSSIFLG